MRGNSRDRSATYTVYSIGDILVGWGVAAITSQSDNPLEFLLGPNKPAVLMSSLGWVSNHQSQLPV
jgi:hypothetical protein